MKAPTLEISFVELRRAYQEVKTFLEEESFEEVKSLNTRIAADLGLQGDDNWDLLTKFVVNYNLDSTSFDYSKHFLSEGELFGSDVMLSRIILLPLKIYDFVAKLLFKSKKTITPYIFRRTEDLTFGDILTWYLSGEFKLRREVRVQIKTPHNTAL